MALSIAKVAQILAVLSTAPGLFFVSNEVAGLSDTDVSRIYNYLTVDVGSQGKQPGGSYKSGTTGLQLPLSFWSSVEYFGEYVCKLSDSPCKVLDVYNPGTYELFPSKTTQKGGELQIERLMTITGINVYDAACYQIATSLGALKLPDRRGQLTTLSTNIDTWLTNGIAGEEPNGVRNSWRAPTRWDGLFYYGTTKITNPANAYFFRAWPRRWLQYDPFQGTPYENFITTDLSGATDPVYQKGKITWADFKPITGENAWGIYIGPIQSIYIREVLTKGQTCVDISADAIRNAIDALVAVEGLQTKYGAVLYAAAGSLGNQGDTAVDIESISTENNASLYAGLKALQQLLAMVKKNGCPADPSRLSDTQTKLDRIITGMEKYFTTYAWDPVNKVIRTGGYARPSGFVPYAFTDPSNPQAVDVITWGISAITPQFFEEKVAQKDGASMEIWTQIKSFAGYKSSSGKLMGVGYSNLDNNQVLSGEWTFGAINFLRTVKAYYKDSGRSDLASYIPQIDQDLAAMMDGVEKLRTDTYGSAGDGLETQRPSQWNTLIPVPNNQLAYLYASKRYFIPFGWYANPLPSTTSSAWALMLHYNFNPFVLGGSYSVPVTPPSLTTGPPTTGGPTTSGPVVTTVPPVTSSGPDSSTPPSPTTSSAPGTTAPVTTSGPTTAGPVSCSPFNAPVNNLHLTGGDIGYNVSSTPSGCCAFCTGECDGITWSSFQGGVCFLKSSKIGYTAVNVSPSGVFAYVSYYKGTAPTPAPGPTGTSSPGTTAGPSVPTPAPTPGPTSGPTPAPTPAPTTAVPLPASCSSYSFFPNLNLANADYKTVAGASYGDCCAACDGPCEAFTWSSANGGTCSLKTSQAGFFTPGKAPAGGNTVVSSLRSGVVYQRISFEGDQADKQVIATPTDCMNACKSKSNCKAFSWDAFSTGNVCLMLSSVTNIVTGGPTAFAGISK